MRRSEDQKIRTRFADEIGSFPVARRLRILLGLGRVDGFCGGLFIRDIASLGPAVLFQLRARPEAT